MTAYYLKHEMNIEPKHFPFFGSTCVILKSYIHVNTKPQTCESCKRLILTYTQTHTADSTSLTTPDAIRMDTLTKNQQCNLCKNQILQRLLKLSGLTDILMVSQHYNQTIT